jgi:preprotein translocase subunit SecF
MLLLSLLVIAGGIAGIFVNDGFNLGIDFLSGINMRVQIAEKALEVSYSGSDRAVLNIREGVCQVNIISEGGLQRDEHVLSCLIIPPFLHLLRNFPKLKESL